MIRLNRRITFETSLVTTNAVGGDDVTWSDYITLWANVKELSDEERIRSGHQDSKKTYKITIRYRDDINPEMMIRHKDRELKIHGIREIEDDKFRVKDRFQEITASEHYD